MNAQRTSAQGRCGAAVATEAAAAAAAVAAAAQPPDFCIPFNVTFIVAQNCPLSRHHEWWRLASRNNWCVGQHALYMLAHARRWQQHQHQQ